MGHGLAMDVAAIISTTCECILYGALTSILASNVTNAQRRRLLLSHVRVDDLCPRLPKQIEESKSGYDRRRNGVHGLQYYC